MQFLNTSVLAKKSGRKKPVMREVAGIELHANSINRSWKPVFLTLTERKQFAVRTSDLLPIDSTFL